MFYFVFSTGTHFCMVILTLLTPCQEYHLQVLRTLGRHLNWNPYNTNQQTQDWNTTATPQHPRRGQQAAAAACTGQVDSLFLPLHHWTQAQDKQTPTRGQIPVNRLIHRPAANGNIKSPPVRCGSRQSSRVGAGVLRRHTDGIVRVRIRNRGDRET